MEALFSFLRRRRPMAYRSRYTRLHVWIPGVVSVVFGDETTGYRFALLVRRRKVFGWRYSWLSR